MRFILNPFSKRLDAFEADIGPVGDVETLTGDAGGAISPTAGNITLAGGTNIGTSGAGSTITINLDSAITLATSVTSPVYQLNANNYKASATTQTIGAVTSDIVTINLGAVAGVYVLEGHVVGFNTTDGAGGGYFVSSSARTTGVAGIEIASEVTEDFEEAAMLSCDVTFVISGNNGIIRVLGIAGKTINWRIAYEYSLVT